MKKGEQFKIESVEELKEAHEMFEDEWCKDWTIKKETFYFNMGCKWVSKNDDGNISLNTKTRSFKTIPSPLKKEKIKRLEKELAELKALPKIKLQVHDRFKYVVFNRSDDVLIYKEKPDVSPLGWIGTWGILEHLPQKTIDYLRSLNWKESLHEIEHIE